MDLGRCAGLSPVSGFRAECGRFAWTCGVHVWTHYADFRDRVAPSDGAVGCAFDIRTGVGSRVGCLSSPSVSELAVSCLRFIRVSALLDVATAAGSSSEAPSNLNESLQAQVFSAFSLFCFSAGGASGKGTVTVQSCKHAGGSKARGPSYSSTRCGSWPFVY